VVSRISHSIMERLIGGVGGVAEGGSMESEVSGRGNEFGGLSGWVVVDCVVVVIGSGSIGFNVSRRG